MRPRRPHASFYALGLGAALLALPVSVLLEEFVFGEVRIGAIN